MTTTEIDPRITQGWDYRPGTFRCDRGWNAGDVSFGCREPGVMQFGTEWLCPVHARSALLGTTPICEGIWVTLLHREKSCRKPATLKVNAELLCADHAEGIPGPDEMDYRDCPECRADRGMEHRPGAPGHFYWCPGCNTEWREAGRYPNAYRPTVLEFAFVILRVLYTLALFLGLTLLVTTWFEPDFANVSEGRQVFAALSGAGAALLPTLVGSWLTNEILYWSAYGLGWAAHYVLGGPVQKGGADNA